MTWYCYRFRFDLKLKRTSNNGIIETIYYIRHIADTEIEQYGRMLIKGGCS